MVVSGVLVLLWLWVVKSWEEIRLLRNLLVVDPIISHIVSNLALSSSIVLLIDYGLSRSWLGWLATGVVDSLHYRSYWGIRK